MQENQGLGEQALNKAAEIGLSSQLDEVEALDVDIETDPLKLVQGQVDSVTIAGEGMVMQKDLRMEELDMHMSGVAINPLSAAFGKIIRRVMKEVQRVFPFRCPGRIEGCLAAHPGDLHGRITIFHVIKDSQKFFIG